LPPQVSAPSFLIQSFDARGTLLVGGPEGVFRSLDAGSSWQPTPAPVYRAVSAAFTEGSTIVSRGRLFQRGNLSYDHVLRPQRAPFGGGYASILTWVPFGKLYAYVESAPSRLYVSVDSARSWYPRPTIGLPQIVRDLAAASVPGRADTLFAACAAAGLWRSVDGGIHWRHLPAAGAGAWAVTTSPASPGRVIVATPRVRWSDDYGRTWHSTKFSAKLLAADPRNGSVFFAVGDDGQLHASSDGGRTW
jgi:photosystem II stability/assembly factor-like uncharacterized protein